LAFTSAFTLGRIAPPVEVLGLHHPVVHCYEMNEKGFVLGDVLCITLLKRSRGRRRRRAVGGS
jgi:hypothetical protein